MASGGLSQLDVFRTAVQLLRQLPERQKPLNFGLSIAVLAHRDTVPATSRRVISSPGGPGISAGELWGICNVSWRKDSPFRLIAPGKDIYKPFESFYPAKNNNWRNSAAPQAGVATDAPVAQLTSAAFLAESRLDCVFRTADGICESPAGAGGEVHCHNPSKRGTPQPGAVSAASVRPKLLGRTVTGGALGYWYLEPSEKSLNALLRNPIPRVPALPFAFAMLGGTGYWGVPFADITIERLRDEIGLTQPLFDAVFDSSAVHQANQEMSTLTGVSLAPLPMRSGPAAPPTPPAAPSAPPTHVPSGSTALSTPAPYIPRTAADYKAVAAKQGDPQKRSRLQEKANKDHRTTLNALAAILTASGYAVKEQLDGYDLFAEHPVHGGHLFEIKTWTLKNLAKQTRSGWAQLYEYGFRNFSDPFPSLYLVFDREPPPHWMWEWLHDDLGVLPCWMDGAMLNTFPEWVGDLPPLAAS